MSALFPDAAGWVDRVAAALADAGARYPFLAYGTDWLAFAHLIIAVVFLGPLIDPVRNIWVIQFGVIACAGIIPLALIAERCAESRWGGSSSTCRSGSSG